LLLEVEPPKPLKCQGDAMLERPQNFEKARIEQQISESMLSQLYLIENEKRNPRLAETFHLDHGKTRRLAVAFAGNTWDRDIIPFRESLINVQRYVSLLYSTKPISNSVFI
jgi:hypothetical protein